MCMTGTCIVVCYRIVKTQVEIELEEMEEKKKKRRQGEAESEIDMISNMDFPEFDNEEEIEEEKFVREMRDF